MNGFQVIFYTQQNRRHDGKMLGEWIVDLAKELGLRGATMVSGIEGFGHTGKIHSAHFFELADQPMEVRLAMTDEEDQRLFERLAIEDVALFYIKMPIELGFVGKAVEKSN
ncbi:MULTISPECIES: DUF190 domain-containing protein [unclassified Pseudomonas]|uniref:DUF190 domain-containing protein n=1 Tax=unclassified Pseudomonas TaxID=196821 RepID=UPI002AC9D43E|nr:MULTISPECIES: DUF190 domain-containing protein [unclassified Pseudomonas]MEB0041222.1 DUF190 domain-containing protein [Pseudomonas sp. MH10]MEB0078311.1 DUF190 domain-containing protein [Pseudomonas sp. MH10out]MEB0092272.1 DUF190 domain-containing protein [Pseudomonas sp. CCI4.2]MEB0101765.1 DUF190 domain-containing protein [Pseudomonas sp. CCI3.2]MEB0123349.1 DUF190 domain-containing protein [Pseudomonas sp. CCI1.2]